MSNSELKSQVKDLFRELHAKAEECITRTRSREIAAGSIMNIVSSTVTAECEGYAVDLYTNLAKHIKTEQFFCNPDHLNAFYRLNLRQALNDKYHFDINSLDSYKKGIEFKSVNQIYIAIGAAAGTLAVGGILKYSLSRNVNVPFAVIIAGAVAAACISIFYVVPEKNKTRFRHAVHMFLNELESDVVTWIEEVERFFDSQVKTLYNEQE